MASMPMKEPDAVPGMYTVEFTKERLGFRVMDCSEDEHKLRVGLITDQTMEEWLTEKDEIYALNGATLSELGCKSHQDFAREVVSISERPLYVSFISEDSLSQARVEAAAAADEGILAAVGHLGQAIGFGGGDDDEEEVVKVTSISFSEGTQGGMEPLSPRSSMRQDYEVKEANDWDPDLSEEFGFSDGYHPFSLKYTKYLKLDPNNANMDKVERGYLEFGKKVLVRSTANAKGEYGVVVQHYKKYNRKKEWDKKGDTCDVKLWDGYTLKNVVLDDMTPIEIVYIPLACGLSLEDFCLYGACLGCVWSTLCAFFGILMFAHEETAHAQTALTTFFFMGIGFAVALVMIVYIGRTLAVIQADEEAAAEARAEEGEFQNVDDEEVGLMGAGLQVEAM